MSGLGPAGRAPAGGFGLDAELPDSTNKQQPKQSSPLGGLPSLRGGPATFGTPSKVRAESFPQFWLQQALLPSSTFTLHSA
jgi:hypothetical protein